MKTTALTITLILALTGAGFAQSGNEARERNSLKEIPAMDWNFGMPERYINVRDYAYFSNKAKLIIELNNPRQYEELKSLDTLLKRLLQEISFYKDSLENGSGSVRIDYVLDDSYPFSKIRFRKHKPDGEIFLSKGDEIARLKVEQDTVHIYVKHNPLFEPSLKKMKSRYDPFTQAQFYELTFCLNDYNDLARIAANKDALQHAFDTLWATKKTGSKVNPYNCPSSSRFNPYATDSVDFIDNIGYMRKDVRFIRYRGLVTSDNLGNCCYLKPSTFFTLDGNIVAGLVRNTFAPYAELGFTLTKQSRNRQNEVYSTLMIRTFVSSYFIFERNTTDNFSTVIPVFVNADFGDNKDFTFGLGYKISGNDKYFPGHTGKAFLNVGLLKNGLRLSPEIIFTNNFSQVFPGLTLKVF